MLLVPETLEFIHEIKADLLPSFQSLNIQTFRVTRLIIQQALIGQDINVLIAVGPKMIFEVLNRYISICAALTPIIILHVAYTCFKAIDQAIESIKQAEDVERILPLLRTNLMDDDVRCTYLSAKALQDLIKIDRYLPSLIKHQQFWQGRTNKLCLRLDIGIHYQSLAKSFNFAF